MDRTVIRIDETTYRLEDGFVRAFLLSGSGKAILIDTGVSGPGLRAQVEALTDRPVILINTHGDGDHTSANGEFPACYLCRADVENCRFREKFPDCHPRDILDGDRFDLGGRILRVIAVPGHTYGSVALLDETNRALYSGDTVQDGHIFMFGAHRAPELFEAALEKLIGLKGEYDVIYPSHGTPELPNDYAEKVLQDWRSVRSGAVPFELTEIMGTTVKSCTAEQCGFYLS